ncbi:hypothetical protein [Algibacter sp. PT7-4]|uniref:hypothetical protein n=1 Tax=Algibacter ulvanivorans TaxID=3400999 RepID=UPI003AB0C650
MKTNSAKKILIVSAITLGSLIIYGQKKINTASEVMSNIKVGVKKISNFKFSFSNVSFNAVLTLQNLTNIDFGATLTSKIVIKQIRVYNIEGVYLGKADVNIYQLNLPSRQIVELPEATFKLSLDKAANEFLKHSQDYLDKNFERLNYKVDVEVFGNIITLEA